MRPDRRMRNFVKARCISSRHVLGTLRAGPDDERSLNQLAGGGNASQFHARRLHNSRQRDVAWKCAEDVRRVAVRLDCEIDDDVRQVLDRE